MKKTIATAVFFLASNLAVAGTGDCQDMYVGQVIVSKGQGLHLVTFKNGPNDGGASKWVSFDTWTLDDKKSALALLTSAKIASVRVNVAVAGGCAINTVQISDAETVSLASIP